MAKRFGGVSALRNGTLAVKPGEVHLLMGENGAGKSTLMKIAAGMLKPDGGTFEWRGQRVSLSRPADAARLGIAMVHQESLLAPHLTVAENIYLGREASWRFQLPKILHAAARLIEEHRFPLQADWRVDRLSPAGRQMVEICRAIAHGSSLLIFDEPTSSLSNAETEQVFRIVGDLKKRGAGVIYITHRLEELRTIGDRVTVLRDGETVHTGDLADLSREELIRHMVGRELSAIYDREPLPPGGVALRVRGLSSPPFVKNVSFDLRSGEIVGLAGLVGAGRTELCRAIFGVDRALSGEVEVHGARFSARSPRDAREAGIALIPEDRGRHGLARLLPVAPNLSAASLDRLCRAGFVEAQRERALVETFVEKLRIRTAGSKQLAGRLSGGNQQKVVIGKWVARGAKVFLFDEPTRGIDVGAKAEVFRVMDSLAREGAAILMVSSELPELLGVADRILVMRQGEIAGELPRGSTQEEAMRLAV
ncbi:MAG: sugar ABC transporter ATP-binding protein [Bryobacteraceae bacterium]|nr:sugar ABC transporter ATP-binding protein [Bryobacteraceae bacterium]